MKKSLLLLITLIVCQFSLKAQVDTEFWFAAPDLSSQHQESPIKLCFASYSNAADITITQPANPTFSPIQVHINAGAFTAIDVSNRINIIETQPANTVLNYGLHIVATDSIMAYYDIIGNNSEMYTLKGANALGTEFVVPMQYQHNNHNYTTYPPRSSIEIVATEDSTVVTIESPHMLYYQPSNVPLVITLNKGQCYAVKAISLMAADHIRNTRIHSNKPIAVNSSDDSIELTGATNHDLVGEQIVPVTHAGNFFIVVSNFSPMESFFVFPTQDNTQIFINNGALPVATLNIGGEYMQQMSNNPANGAMLITSTKPIFVWHLTAHSTAPEGGATILPQLACTGSRKAVFGRSQSGSVVVTLLTHTSNIGGFTYNGDSTIITASDFTILPADTSWAYCRKDVTSHITVGGSGKIENNLGFFHLGIYNSTIDYCTYGYYSDYHSGNTLAFNMEEEHCTGGTIEFGYEGEGVSSIHVEGPNMFYDGEAPFTLHDAAATDAGTYYIYGYDDVYCDDSVSDMIELTILPPEETTFDTIVCDSIQWNDSIYYMDGSYEQTLKKDNSLCDSVVTMNLQVQYRPLISQIVGEVSMVMADETQSGISTFEIESIPGVTQYEWLLLHDTWTIQPAADGLSCIVVATQKGTDTLVVRALNNCGWGELFLRLTASPIGIEEQGTMMMTIMPNPTQGIVQINLEALTEKAEVEVYDAVGTLIDQFAISPDNASGYNYNMSDKTAGVYVFRVISGENIRTQRVVLMH